MGPKEWYCNTKGGELFGRPLTEDLQEALSNEIKAQSEKWMPPRTYTGMERNNNGYDMGKKSELWKFYDEDEIFHQSDYKVWNQEPTKGDDCAVVGLETEFKVEEENCLIAHACETPNLFYSNYDGFCLSVVDDHKSYPNAIGSCAEGHLLKMRNLSYVEPTIQAFYNSKFNGGIYIGLELKDNGTWIYNNGEEEKDVQTPYGKHMFECGAVRLLENMTLSIISHPCFPERQWFLCEVYLLMNASA
ncbi:uncharacterized protein TNCV_4017211 [Trichonephila clavipes]|nr:uncharacterized protein TNCV_4017211 [Trichonephila clavipes]